MTKADATKTAQTPQEAPLPDAAEVFGAAPYEGDLDPSDRAGGTSAPGTKFYAIAQNQGTNVEKISNAGKFYTKNDEGDLVFYQNLDVVILDSGPRSTRFEEDHVACKSYDGKVGINGQLCKDCEFNFFKDNNIEKTLKCKNTRLLLCVPADDWNAEPFFLQITAAAIKDWQKYASELQNRYKRPVFSCITRISTVLRKENMGMTYVPVFTPIKGFGTEDINTLRDIRIVESIRFKAPEEEIPASSNGTPAAEAPAPAPTFQKDDFDDPFMEE